MDLSQRYHEDECVTALQLESLLSAQNNKLYGCIWCSLRTKRNWVRIEKKTGQDFLAVLYVGETKGRWGYENKRLTSVKPSSWNVTSLLLLHLTGCLASREVGKRSAEMDEPHFPLSDHGRYVGVQAYSYGTWRRKDWSKYTDLSKEYTTSIISVSFLSYCFLAYSSTLGMERQYAALERLPCFTRLHGVTCP
jgi:hypothetical protein